MNKLVGKVITATDASDLETKLNDFLAKVEARADECKMELTQTSSALTLVIIVEMQE